jgi:hypothetical protein
MGGFIAYSTHNWLTLKLSANYTTVDGADSLIKDQGTQERWRHYRNLSFRSRIWETNVSAEFFPLLAFNQNFDIKKINPYIGLGVGMFHFNPQAKYQGQWIDLKPLHTEGEGFPGIDPATGKAFPKNYSLLQMYIPITLGIKMYFSNTFALSLGVTFRHTFTDYIDDISTVYINPALFDKYLTPQQAAMAKQLYSRSITPWKVRPGVLKSDPTDKDSYSNIFVSLSIRFNNGVPFYYGGQDR